MGKKTGYAKRDIVKWELKAKRPCRQISSPVCIHVCADTLVDPVSICNHKIFFEILHSVAWHFTFSHGMASAMERERTSTFGCLRVSMKFILVHTWVLWCPFLHDCHFFTGWWTTIIPIRVCSPRILHGIVIYLCHLRRVRLVPITHNQCNLQV